jgi:hypothetical protein
MVWQYHPPIPVGRRGLFYSFKLFLPACTTLKGGGGGSAHWAPPPHLSSRVPSLLFLPEAEKSSRMASCRKDSKWIICVNLCRIHYGHFTFAAEERRKKVDDELMGQCFNLILLLNTLIALRHNQRVAPQGANPSRFLYALRRQVEIIWTRKLSPSSPLV